MNKEMPKMVLDDLVERVLIPGAYITITAERYRSLIFKGVIELCDKPHAPSPKEASILGAMNDQQLRKARQ